MCTPDPSWTAYAPRTTCCLPSNLALHVTSIGVTSYSLTSKGPSIHQLPSIQLLPAAHLDRPMMPNHPTCLQVAGVKICVIDGGLQLEPGNSHEDFADRWPWTEGSDMQGTVSAWISIWCVCWWCGRLVQNVCRRSHKLLDGCVRPSVMAAVGSSWRL